MLANLFIASAKTFAERTKFAKVAETIALAAAEKQFNAEDNVRSAKFDVEQENAYVLYTKTKVLVTSKAKVVAVAAAVAAATSAADAKAKAIAIGANYSSMSAVDTAINIASIACVEASTKADAAEIAKNAADIAILNADGAIVDVAKAKVIYGADVEVEVAAKLDAELKFDAAIKAAASARYGSRWVFNDKRYLRRIRHEHDQRRVQDFKEYCKKVSSKVNHRELIEYAQVVLNVIRGLPPFA